MKTGIDIGLGMGGRNPHVGSAKYPPNDTTLVNFRSLWIGTTGDVAIGHKADPDTPVVYANVPAGTLLPVEGRRVFATGTTASDIIAFGGSFASTTLHIPPAQPGDPPINEPNVMVVDFIKDQYVLKDGGAVMENSDLAASPLVYAGDAKYVSKGGLLVLTDGINVPLGDEGYLCEPAATNLLTQSNNLTGWSFTDLTITASADTGPDGVAGSAVKLVEGNADSEHRANKQVTSIGIDADGTNTIIVKAAERSHVYLRFYDGVQNDGIVVDLTSGEITDDNAAGYTKRISREPNGYWEIALSYTQDLSAAVSRIQINICDGPLRSDNSYDGDGTSGIYLWNAQLETGPVATSPIITGAATVTRAADSLTLATTEMPWWPISVAGTGYVNGPLGGAFAATRSHLRSAFASQILTNGGGDNRVNSFDGATGIKSLDTGDTPVGPTRKGAVAWDGGGTVSQYVDGGSHAGAMDIATANGYGTGTTLGIGCAENGTEPTIGHIKAVALVPRKFTNQELIDLTT